jgi:hypothetical protein
MRLRLWMRVYRLRSLLQTGVLREDMPAAGSVQGGLLRPVVLQSPGLLQGSVLRPVVLQSPGLLQGPVLRPVVLQGPVLREGSLRMLRDGLRQALLLWHADSRPVRRHQEPVPLPLVLRRLWRLRRVLRITVLQRWRLCHRLQRPFVGYADQGPSQAG